MCPFRAQGCTSTPARAELEKHKSLCSFRPDALSTARSTELAALKVRTSAGAALSLADLLGITTRLVELSAFTDAGEVVPKLQPHFAAANPTDKVSRVKTFLSISWGSVVRSVP